MGRNTLKLDLSGFNEMIAKLESLGQDVKPVVEQALQQASEKISADTESALAYANLPARGKFSSGDTAGSVVRDSTVQWDGNVAWVPVGFDFGVPGAGGFLIKGTPKMSPDKELAKIYRQKSYMKKLQDEMSDVVLEKIVEAL